MDAHAQRGATAVRRTGREYGRDQRYAHERLLAPIDLSRIPNRRRRLPNFQQLAAIDGLVEAGAAYAIPFTYSSMGLIYDRKQVPAAPRSMRS